MIKIWTTTNKTALLTDVFAPAFKSFRPDIPEHQFEQYEQGWTPTPPPDGVLLACGDKLMKQLASQGIVPKGRSVNSLREKVFHHTNGGVYMVTFDPNLTMMEPDKKGLVQWDTKLSVRWEREKTLKPKIGKYSWVPDFESLIERVDAMYEKTGQPVDLAGDLETMGFSPFVPGKQIVSIAFTLEPGTSDILYTGPKFQSPTPTPTDSPVRDQVEYLLTSPKIKTRWANGKFDMSWLRVCWGIECTNFAFDACLVGSLLDENQSCSLNTLTKVYTPWLGGYDDDFSDKYDKSKFEDIPPNEDFATYGGGDTDATQQVSSKLKADLLAQPRLANFYVNLLHPATRTFEKIESRGVHVDRNAYYQLRDDLRKEVASLQKQALEQLPRRLKMRHLDKIEAQIAAGKNPLTPKIKAEYFFDKAGLGLKPKMFTGKTGDISTAAAHFEMFSDEPKAATMIKALDHLSTAEKALGTYVDGFLKHLHTDDKFHASYFLFHGRDDWATKDNGTTTGRLSARDPAFQTLPKHHPWANRLRECFPAPPGYLMFEIDFSQGELRVAACVAPDPGMVAAYKEGMDLHAITGALAAGYTYEEVVAFKKSLDEMERNLAKTIRQGGKAGNFGLLYGMQPPGFVNYARTVYGVEMSVGQATDFRDAFFAKWKGLLPYHNRMEAQVRQTTQVSSPLGRVRHLPQIHSWSQEVSSKAVRQAINSPVQSTLSDMMLLYLTELESSFATDDLHTVGMVHDACVGYVREDKAVDLIKQAVELADHLPYHKFGWKPELSFPVDAKVGPGMASMLEWT